MTAPDDPTQQVPPVRPRDRRGPASIAGTGLALVAGIVVWAIVASSGDDGSVSIGPDTTPRTDTTSTSGPAPTVPTTLAPPPSVVLVPTTAVTPGSVVIVPTAPPATTSPSPPTSGGTTPTTSATSTPTTRPGPDVAAITEALTEALLGPDAEPPAEPVVRVVVSRRQVRVTWRIGNEDDLEAARTGGFEEAARMLEALTSFAEVEGRPTMLDGTYPLPKSDGTTRTRRVIRLVFQPGTLDGVDVGGLDPAALVALADQAIINPAFTP